MTFEQYLLSSFICVFHHSTESVQDKRTLAAFQSNIYIKSHLILRYLFMIALLALLLCARAQQYMVS